MEQFIRHGFDAQNIPGYDCRILNQTEEYWYSKGTKNVTLGVIFAVYGITTQILYLFIMAAMWQLNTTNNVYKIMFLLAFFDVFELSIASDYSAYMWIVGGTYCTHPNLNFFLGAMSIGGWCGLCLGCLILGANRLADLWNKSLQEQLFGGKRIWFWLCLPIVYGSLLMFFTTPVLFNSTLNTWFFCPFITGGMEESLRYYNIFHAMNNVGVVAFTSILYIAIILVWRFKYCKEETIRMKFQRSITIQAVLICSASLVASLIYVYMQYFYIPDWMMLASHFVWQASHGIPAYVYLTMNKTIRKNMLRMFRIRITSPVVTLGSCTTPDRADRIKT